MTARRSLRDRNRAAIALDPETPDVEPAAELRSSASPAVQQEAPAPTRSPAKRRPPADRTAGPTARLGIYLTPAEFEAAKAAYLGDWSNGGSADTFARWIAGAIDEHAARTPRQRAAGAEPRGRAEERTGSTRLFSIAVDTVARMRAAITADQKAGRWPSDSAWCGEAIGHAVSRAREQNGGTLPTPPPRLPNRLMR